MSNTAIKVSQLPVANTIARTDRIVVLVNPSTTANVKTANIDVIFSNVAISNSTPANSTANGYTGTIRVDTDYLYICVSNNVWKRVTLDSW
jgi:hypothetical protein